MDNAISQILYACRLARELEESLPNLANGHPSILRNSLEDVVVPFNNAVRDLDMLLRGGDHHGLQAMDFFGPRVPVEDDSAFMGLEQIASGGFGVGSSSFSTGQDVGDSSEMAFLGSGAGGGVEVQQAEAGAGAAAEGSLRRPGTGSTGQKRPRKRMDRGMRSIRVPALRTGNTENPPDDGYTWRKYGQKDILGSRFPRSYFRCTHRNFYGCEAKKQVQRLDEDPYTYEVTYCGEHTCQTSPTPLILPPIVTTSPQQPDVLTAMVDAAQLHSPSLSASIQRRGSWIELGAQRAFQQPHGGGEGSGAAAHAGPLDCPVADLADVMFNSGSSGSSMDAIFSLGHESWKDKVE